MVVSKGMEVRVLSRAHVKRVRLRKQSNSFSWHRERTRRPERVGARRGRTNFQQKIMCDRERNRGPLKINELRYRPCAVFSLLFAWYKFGTWRAFIAMRDGGFSSAGRAPGCGPGGRGFEPHKSPKNKKPDEKHPAFCIFEDDVWGSKENYS